MLISHHSASLPYTDVIWLCWHLLLVSPHRRAKPRLLGWLFGFKQPPPCQVIRQVSCPHPMKAPHPSLQAAHIAVHVLNVVFLADHSLIIEYDQSMVGNPVVAGEGFILAVPVRT